MSKEDQPRPGPFEFTEREELFDRISDARFRELIELESTTFHEIDLSTNSYGEFVFATVSWQSPQGREAATFWSLGYHEYRERWIGREWFWYRTERRNLHERRVAREEFMEQLEERAAYVASFLDEDSQSERGRLFELLADMTDDDGAIADLDEYENWLDSLDGEL
jgi:hypothetical protein